jgi:aryl-alcohol dehydrogenase-like predicted oxidoreductase
MKYHKLGNSGLDVSEVGLGGDTFGRDIDELTTASVIHHALDQGINYIDTADVYGWGGWSERYIGAALKGRRSQAIIATKFGIGVDANSPQGTAREGLGSREYIMKAVDDSLERLETDYIDLYQIHAPDPVTPVEETLGALDDLVRAGKVRHIGCSNFSAWELCESLWVSKARGLNSFISIQPRYSLLDRHVEEELAPCCLAYNIGIIPWYPLAGGFLTGKYRRGQAPSSDTRFGSNPAFYGYILNDSNFDILEKLEAFAAQRNHTVAELAFAWLLSHSWITTVIAGVTKVEQVHANVKSSAWKLTAEDVAQLDRDTNYRMYSVFSNGGREYVLPPGYLRNS